MRSIFIIVVFVSFFLFSVISCNSNNNNAALKQDSSNITTVNSVKSDVIADSTRIENKELGKEYTAKYICPNHCKGSGSDQEGECPVCGMDLMENPNYKKN